MPVSPPASTAFCRGPNLAIRHQISKGFTRARIDNDRPDRHFDNEGRAAFPGFLFSLAAFAVGCFELTFELKMIEGSLSRCRDQPDIAALAAVAAVGTTPWNEPLPPEADTARTAVAGLNGKGYFIDKFHAS